MIGTSENQYVGSGPGFGGGFGGFGSGIAPFGLFGLLGLSGLDRRHDGHGGHGHDGGCAREAALLAAIANSKDTTVAEGRNLANAICESEKTNLQQFYAAAIQAANNTQAIKDQASAIAVVADKRFDDLAAAGVAQTAAIIAKLNQTEIDTLRDQLHGERRRSDNREIEISITNSNAQAQAQIQAQNFEINRKFDALFSSFNQLNKNTNDVINFGVMAASGNQANQQTNVK